ncbi:ChbG/HpnK family deacetylase [Cytophagaceae bacterium 50C-KIRBA]|uniref:ChbG/HpnK family deacetylase n=2 Tax=Aquirufa beregesia TaxID=2516556 RepID=A0ABX0EYR0_9BACT|nr:ChbG/HpnK family deacetylase [Aquirufa beregesia]
MKKVLLMLLCTFQAWAQNLPAPRLIVRGDDMGYSHSGNLALMQSSLNGIQSSIEVIVPSPWFPEAVQMLQAHPNIDVGIHLALTSEWDKLKWRPLTEAKSLRDPDGYFFPMVYANKQYPGLAIVENKFTLADIEAEFRAQIELAIKKIPRISHITSHMGCSRINAEVIELTKRLAKEYHLIYENTLYPFERASYDGPFQTSTQKIASFIKMLRRLQAGKTYCFVDHPGLDDAELKAVSHIGYEGVAADRQGVTDVFTSQQVKDAIRDLGIQIISYRDLGPRP